ncbi:hypothetical protein [Haloarchaeobius sp. HME9146]|uniref:DUF7474 family protein n=1 Tax=Haloarchaeobius sp. HME9146 TaxID=2978732 RepID=UPI0021BF2ECC|nr:hypothetical protein [Haloarchaeobius sp. HME9146]MCT9095074.1 hypothetical protein [Haloarchaeobius sp. HME9146]
MARHFEYPCPDCRSTNDLHDPDCEFAGVEWHDVEKAYADILAVLSSGVTGEEELRDAVDEFADWGRLHHGALRYLRNVQRVEERRDRLELLDPDEYRDRLTKPQYEPVKTIYEKGSVPGCHDNSVFAMVAYYEMVGLTWEETREQVLEWLDESGTWRRGGFAEETPEDLVDSKRHVFEAGYGWKQAAREAKAVIDRSL